MSVKIINSNKGLMLSDGKLKHIVDFSTNSFLYRCNKITQKTEKLLQAFKIPPSNNHYSILDITAGFATDGFLLACQGAEVTLLENNLIVYQAVNDAIQRLQTTQNLQTIINRLKIIYIDSRDFLEKCIANKRQYNAIYIDPMFPVKGKTSKAKKELQLLQKLITNNTLSYDNISQINDIIKLAKQVVMEKIVIKAPKQLNKISDFQENYCIYGKTCCFYVYLK